MVLSMAIEIAPPPEAWRALVKKVVETKDAASDRAKKELGSSEEGSNTQRGWGGNGDGDGSGDP